MTTTSPTLPLPPHLSTPKNSAALIQGTVIMITPFPIHHVQSPHPPPIPLRLHRRPQLLPHRLHIRNRPQRHRRRTRIRRHHRDVPQPENPQHQRLIHPVIPHPKQLQLIQLPIQNPAPRLKPLRRQLILRRLRHPPTHAPHPHRHHQPHQRRPRRKHPRHHNPHRQHHTEQIIPKMHPLGGMPLPKHSLSPARRNRCIFDSHTPTLITFPPSINPAHSPIRIPHSAIHNSSLQSTSPTLYHSL